MAWYWPKIQDETSAEAAVKPAFGVSAFVAAVSGLIAVLSIAYRKPILGINGWSLVDALLFVVIAWRIGKMSRAWAVVGLLMYLVEVGSSGALGVLTIIFILTYINAIRGAFAYHRYRKAESNPLAPPAPLA